MSEFGAEVAGRPAFVTDVVVRWSDMDAFGHLNHARTIAVLAQARERWLLDPSAPTSGAHADYRVTEIDVRYAKQVRHGDSPLSVSLVVADVGPADVVVELEVRTVGTAAAERPAVRARCRVTSWQPGGPESTSAGHERSRRRPWTVEEQFFLDSFRRGGGCV